MENADTQNECTQEKSDFVSSELNTVQSFKKPVLLIGKIGKFPKKLVRNTGPQNDAMNITEELTIMETVSSDKKLNLSDQIPSEVDGNKSEDSPKVKPSLENPLKIPEKGSSPYPPVPYKEPDWSGLPESSNQPYSFDVLKNGSIIQTIDLMKRPYWLFGRLDNCDINMQHPTISRYHAVLQYRDIPSENEPPGFYIYDLGSTHGTFINGKNKLKPKIYAPVRVGHMLRLGCSQRTFILNGPEDDQEDESVLSVTELKQLRQQKMKEREEKMKQAELEREEKRKREEEKGVDWGMGDDDEVEEDIAENPFATTTNEELYLDDPKKALRGFFEREGLDLEYDCSEQGMGQFLCKVELPLDDEMGRPLVAEVIHRGKKKEAVVQCALEACKILDRLGMLRQATHESKKRKARNWQENDYYDSDEDTFLDRTGTIEKKREKRMKVKGPEKAETYESLVAKEKQISASIEEIQRKITKTLADIEKSNARNNAEEDPLDSYMKELSENKPDKHTISRLRLELANLRKAHANIVRLANIAKPANLPPLVPSTSTPSFSDTNSAKPSLPIFGKRKAVPVKFPAKPSLNETVPTSQDEEEIESDEESKQDTNPIQEKVSQIPCGDSIVNEVKEPEVDCQSTSGCTENTENATASSERRDYGEDSDSSDSIQEVFDTSDKLLQKIRSNTSLKSFAEMMKTNAKFVTEKNASRLDKILRKLQRLASIEDRVYYDWKAVSAKRTKVIKWVKELAQMERSGHPNEKLEYKVSTELHRILDDLNSMTEDKVEVIDQVKQVGLGLTRLAREVCKNIASGILSQNIAALTEQYNMPSTSTDPENEMIDPSDDGDKNTSDDTEAKKKKNLKRIERRQHTADIEKQKGYEEDSIKEDYNMWVPPTDQSGDGRTSLNDKFGY